jgi:flagellar biosynthetic protein FliR
MLDATTINALMGKFIIGGLIFVRVTAFVASSPFFKHAAIPNTVKIILSILLTAIITSAYWQEQPLIEYHLWYLPVLAMREALVGIALGFGAQMMFMAATFAGGIVDMDMGYQTAILFDKDSTTPTLIGELYNMIVLMVFLFLNGHHQILESLYISLRAVPLTEFAVTESTVTLLIKFATTVLIMGVKMSAPVIVALFCTNLSLALLARVAPQTNIFILSFQLKVFVGLLILSVSVPLFVYVTKIGLSTFQEELLKILFSLNPARV